MEDVGDVVTGMGKHVGEIDAVGHYSAPIGEDCGRKLGAAQPFSAHLALCSAPAKVGSSLP